MIYTAVLYRQNSDDYCMGCHMGSSSSDLQIYNASTKDELIGIVAPLVAESLIYSKEHREYDSFDTIISINGYSSDSSYSFSTSDVQIPELILNELHLLEEELRVKIDEVKKYKEQEIKDKKKQERIFNENKKLIEQEKRDKAEFERLTQKFKGQ